MSKPLKRVIISRTDSIGDVALTLALAGGVKELLPDSEVVFLGRTYTAAVVACCRFVDEFANMDEVQNKSENEKIEFFRSLKADGIVFAFPDREVCSLAQKADIPIRIATAGRLHTWFTCTHRVFFSRRNSGQHEAVLNFNLLKPLGLKSLPGPGLIFGLSGWRSTKLNPVFESLLQDDKRGIIIHPKSKGSAPEWSLEQFQKLVTLLPSDQFSVFVTGTASEGEIIGNAFENQPHVTNLCGQMSLADLIGFISRCDALVAASTGPLHIAGLCGIQAVGLFSPKSPFDPGRWCPIGPKAEVLVASHHPVEGQSLDIIPELVVQRLGVRL